MKIEISESRFISGTPTVTGYVNTSPFPTKRSHPLLPYLLARSSTTSRFLVKGTDRDWIRRVAMNSSRNRTPNTARKSTNLSASKRNFTSSDKRSSYEGATNSRIQEMIQNATGYDDEVNTYTTNTSLHQAKNDLMQLGIELDDELIERLQNNLGIDKIFKVAHDAVHVIKSTTRATASNDDQSHPFDVYGQRLDHPTEMSFRHVPSSQPITKIGDSNNDNNKKKRKHDISSIFTLHQKSTILLLKQLENRDDCIEPQYRPLIDQLLEYLRLLYIRSPKKFLYRLLNKKLLSSEEKKILFSKKTRASSMTNNSTTTDTWGSPNKGPNNNDDGMTSSIEDEEIQLMYKWILQSRYFNYQEFEEMLQRILPPSLATTSSYSMNNNNRSATPLSTSNYSHYSPEVFKAFFLLICDEKRFESSQKKKVVDLWNFLTLLKISSEESRRSYDNMKSKLANDVEFWKRDNNIKYLKQTIINQQNHQQQTTSEDILDPNPRSSWITKTTATAPKPNNHQSDKKFHRKRNDITDPVGAATSPSSKSSGGGGSTGRVPSIASILGHQSYEIKGQTHKGRSVFGTLHQETINKCDIPMALHSSPHRHNDPQYYVIDRYGDGGEGRGGGNKSPAVNKSHKIFQSEHDLPIRPTNDDVFDSSKVSYLLGNEKKRKEITQKFAHQPPPPPPFIPQSKAELVNSMYTTERKTKSIGCYNREIVNTTTVAGAMGKGDADVSSPGPKTLRQYQQRSQSADNRLRMSSVSSLHWEGGVKPSVASALKPTDSFPKRVFISTEI